jgi:hypothetical protein
MVMVSRTHAVRFCLQVNGPSLCDRQIEMSGARLTIGRRPGNDLVLDDLTVSGEHAELRHRAGVTRLRDRGSSNGTRVNGEAVRERVLIEGDRIDIGLYSLTVVLQAGVLQPFESMRPASLVGLLGVGAGDAVDLDRAVVAVPGGRGQLAALSWRRHAWFLTHLEGPGCPLVNGEPIGLTARELDHADLVEIGDALFHFSTHPA